MAWIADLSNDHPSVTLWAYSVMASWFFHLLADPFADFLRSPQDRIGPPPHPVTGGCSDPSCTQLPPGRTTKPHQREGGRPGLVDTYVLWAGSPCGLVNLCCRMCADGRATPTSGVSSPNGGESLWAWRTSTPVASHSRWGFPRFPSQPSYQHAFSLLYVLAASIVELGAPACLTSHLGALLLFRAIIC